MVTSEQIDRLEKKARQSGDRALQKRVVVARALLAAIEEKKKQKK